MAVPDMTQGSSSGVHIVDGTSEWSRPWFAETLIQGLSREGLPDAAATVIREAFVAAKPSNLASLIRVVASSSDVAGPAALLALDGLSKTAAFNSNCYRRTSPEVERTVAWPNNQRTRVADPDYYFDIFEDLPYRETYRFLQKSTPIGSAGSCFALRIAHQLQAWGYNYVIEEDDLPPDIPLERLSSTSYRMAPARWGTLFNTPSMRQMVERAFGLWTPERILVSDGARLIDPFRSIKPNYRDIDGYVADFEKHNLCLRRALSACEVFVITLGLNEAWKFAHSGDFTSVSPYRIDPTLVRAHELTVAENVSELERLYEVYRRHCPGVKLIVSVSPVPLNKTFSTRSHVVAANALSKATLRVAAEEFCRNHPDGAFYFPSYEVVTSGTRNAWEADMRHVSAEAVSRVMKLFQKMFLADQESILPTILHKEPMDRLPLGIRAKGVAKTLLRRVGIDLRRS